jgi:hypothetical protein
MERRSWAVLSKSTSTRRRGERIDLKVLDQRHCLTTKAGARNPLQHEAFRKIKATHTSSIDGNERTQQSTSRDRLKKIVGCMWVACRGYRTKTQSTRRCVRCSKITKCERPYILLPMADLLILLHHELLGLCLINASSEAVSKLISPHPSTAEKPGSHYYLFVDFPSAESATAAAQALDGSPTQWGGTLRVNIAKNNTNRKVDREQYSNRNASPNALQNAPQRDFSSNWRSKG